VIRTLGYFIAGSIVGVAGLAGVYYLREGSYGVLCVAIAGAICIIPTLLSLCLTLWSRGRAGSEQLMAVAGGMFIRMGAVLAISLPVFLASPYFREATDGTASLKRELVYWSAILICYLGTLALETVLAARQKTTDNAARISAADMAGGAT
jgi:hypothetical protein